jgi:hypothetical protein
LRGFLTADRDKVCKTRGFGTARYVVLQAALELTRRHYQELMTVGSALQNPQAIREFVQIRLRDLPYEVFCCLLLDCRYRVLSFEELFRGTIDGAIVHPREVLRLALSRNAAALILVHNHPSGIAEPSPSDRNITVRWRWWISRFWTIWWSGTGYASRLPSVAGCNETPFRHFRGADGFPKPAPAGIKRDSFLGPRPQSSHGYRFGFRLGTPPCPESVRSPAKGR